VLIEIGSIGEAFDNDPDPDPDPDPDYDNDNEKLDSSVKMPRPQAI
jgi:hypothetical protein